MNTNKAIIRLEFDKINVEPVLRDKNNNIISWDDAVSVYNATATWTSVENAELYGIFTINETGRAHFTPMSKGQFFVNCLVRYQDSVTDEWVEINQNLTISITQSASGGDCCEILISTKDNNVITKEVDGLYVPSQDPSLNVRIAGESLSALLAVYELNGKVFKLDFRDGVHITLFSGLTKTAADTDGRIELLNGGVIDDDSFNWVVGRVYIGINGRLTQVPPNDGYLLCVGSAVSKTRLNLNFQDPINLG